MIFVSLKLFSFNFQNLLGRGQSKKYSQLINFIFLTKDDNIKIREIEKAAIKIQKVLIMDPLIGPKGRNNHEFSILQKRGKK